MQGYPGRSNQSRWPIVEIASRTAGACHAVVGSVACCFESWTVMLNQELKNLVVSRILPGVRTPGQYVGGELNSVVKDHRTVRGTVCLAFPDTYALGMSHHGLQVLYSLMNDRGLGLRAGVHALARFRGRPSLSRPAALQPGDVHAAEPVRRRGLLAPVRDLLHERPDDARPGRHPAPRRGPRPGRHAGHRRRPGRAEPRAARALHRPVRHRRRRAKPAGRLRALEGHAGLGPVAGREAGADRRAGGMGLRPAVLRADLSRGRHDPRDPPHPRRRARGDQALRDPRPRRDPAADPADRPVRRDDPRPDRHRDHARLPLAVPLLPEHGHQAAAPVPHGRDDRPGRAGELQQHRLRRDQPALALHQRLSRISRNW